MVLQVFWCPLTSEGATLVIFRYSVKCQHYELLRWILPWTILLYIHSILVGNSVKNPPFSIIHDIWVSFLTGATYFLFGVALAGTFDTVPAGWWFPLEIHIVKLAHARKLFYGQVQICIQNLPCLMIPTNSFFFSYFSARNFDACSRWSSSSKL